MISKTHQPAWLPRGFSLFCSMSCAILLIGSWAATSRGQMGGIDSDPSDLGTGGRNTIQGRVYFPSGRTIDRKLSVRLSGMRSGDRFTMTDDTGAFGFRRLAGGTYTITINDAGKEYQPVYENVDIIDPVRRGGSGVIFTVQIQLRLMEARGSKPATVSATALEVPKPALELYHKALESGRVGDNKKAIDQLKGALVLHPQFMLAYNEMGVQYLNLGQLDKAVESFRSALKITPDAFSPRLNYGIVLVYMKQFKEAEPELRHAVEKNEGSAVTHYYLGRTLANLRRFDEAEKELGRAISLGGDDIKEAHRYLGAVYNERGDPGRAISELETYLRLVPSAKDGDQIRQIIGQLKSEVQSSQKTKSKGR